MELKILSLNARGLNRTTKRRQLFRWLHQQKSDVVFLQETYSSPQTIKIWENEWGGKIVESNGSSHSRGVMILFKPKMNVSVDKVIRDKNGRYILCEVSLDEAKFVFVNIYAPNDQAQQIQFFRDLSYSVLNNSANETLVLGGDFNCPLDEFDKRGGRPVELKKRVIQEINNLISTQDLIDTWKEKNANLQGFTWSNPSMKIQCRLDYFMISKDIRSSLKHVEIVPCLLSDHAALSISLISEENETKRGPGFWRFNNSLLIDKDYVEMICKKIPEYAFKYKKVTDKGLLWEMIKMEIRASTILFSKRKAKQKRDEEKELLETFNRLQEQIRLNFDEATKAEMDRVKIKLAKIVARKTQGAMVRSRARWYEFGEKNSKYFLNLEKRNHKKKHITSLKKEDGSIQRDPKEILEEEEEFFKKIYETKNTSPETDSFKHFFESADLPTLDDDEAESCEGLLTIKECADALGNLHNNKTPGSDGFTIEFYRCFWEMLGQFMVDSFNYAYEHGHLSISQRLGIISLIPKKNKNLEHLKNWRPVSLLNNDYKIATKAIASRMEKVLPKIIHASQTGYVKGRYIGESIRTISDIMSFSKTQNIPGLAVFLDFEKAFDSIEWNYLQKCLETFNFGPQLRQWVNVIYNDISSCILNNGFATRHFNLERGVRQGCPLSGILFVIGIEILGNAIRRSNEIKGIQIDANNTLKITQYADDTTLFLRDIQSLHNLFNLLTQFENCSGLRINQSKSELLWLGSLRHRKDTLLNLKISEDTIYALGVHFSYDEQLAAKRNFFDKLDPLRKVLNIWSSRDISIYGRINIVKTIALSKLTFVCSVLRTPDMFTTEVNKLIFDYVWKYKNPKVKKSTIIKSKENGGLNMIDFTLFDKALKICWVRRLCSEGNQPWKLIPLRFLSNIGGTLLFSCNYDVKSLHLNKNFPSFYNDIISHWQELINASPTTKEDVLDQIVWNNRFIKVNKTSVYFQKWHQAGIYRLSSLLDESKKRFLSFNAFVNQFQVKCNFLQYHGLLSAIPNDWKNSLKQEQQTTTINLPAINKLTCKTIYKLLVDNQNLASPTAEKRLAESGFDANDRQKIYSLPFLTTKEVKLSIFQYKIIHNVLYTNYILHKMKKVQDPHCPFCTNIDQTVTHLFVSCSIANSFWNDFIEWYQSLSKETLRLSKNEIMYGVLNGWPSCSTLNHLILIGKYFLYYNSLNKVKFQFADFVNLVHDKIEIERYIALMSNNNKAFLKKWSNFVN